jgi:trimeric autotransporter adhesin
MKRLLLTIACLAVAGPVAAFAVGGQIDEDTHWTVSDSPLIVESTLSVTSGAQLRIDPGVIVAFSQGASLEVIAGSLYARGLPDDPVLFISRKEFDGQQASPGDWGSIILGPGTLSAATLIEHAQIRHGHGIQVRGSAPQFHHLHLAHNAGAAIDLDLAASPHGADLSASDNAIDGIRVSAGQIIDDVVWALRGIPYVLETGLIRVGRPAYSLLPQTLTVTTGVVAELELMIPEPAEMGGLLVDLVSSVPGVVQVPSSVEIQAGDSSATVMLEAIEPGQSTISASHPDLGLATASVQVLAPPELTLDTQSPSLGIGQSMLIHVSLSEPAVTGGLPVTVEVMPEGIIDAPGQLFLAEGSQSASFAITGLAQGGAMLELDAEGYLGISTSIEVIPPSIQLPMATFTSPAISRRVPVSLSHPAPVGGLIIHLSVSQPDVIELPGSVLVPAGATEAEFDIVGQNSGAVTVTASTENFADGDMQVTVAELTLELDPDVAPWFPVGVSREYAVRLSDPAPPGGLEIDVGLGNPEVAGLSTDSLFIPAGQILASETLIISGESIGETELELAFQGGQPNAFPVRVTEALEVRFSRTAVTIGRGLRSNSSVLRASLWSGEEQFRPFEDVALMLSCADSAICSVHGSPVIGQGDLNTRVTLRGNGVGESLLIVDQEDLGQGSQTVVTVVNPELRIESLSGTRSVGSARDSGRLRWYVPGGTSSNQASSTLDETATVWLAIIEDQPAGLVDGIWNQSSGGQLIAEMNFPAGANQSAWFYVGSPVVDGSYRLRAEMQGLAVAVSAEQLVLTPGLAFTRSSMVAGRGLVSHPNVLRIQREIDGSPFNGSEALEVSLACVDDQICGVPASVTIPANSSRVAVRVTGLAPGESAITAVADEHNDALPTHVTVVDPELRIQSLSGTRSIGSVRDSARLRWVVPGGTSSNEFSSTMAETSEVALAIVNDQPEGLVDGLWNLSDGGEQIDGLTFPAGANLSAWFYVGTPSQAGVYTLRAAIDGLVESLSAEQTVLNPELSFTRTTMVTGHGLVSNPSVLRIERRVDGSPFNGTEPVEVQLNCADTNICQAPASVVIPANQSRASIPVTGIGLGSTVVLATAEDHQPANPATIEVVEPELLIQSLSGTRAVGSVRDSARLRWHVPGGTLSNQWSSTMAESGQAMIAIIDDQPEGLIDGLWSSANDGELITAIDFPAGSNLTGWFYVGVPTATGTYRLSASITGLATNQSTVQTVVIPELRFSRSEFVAGRGMISTGNLLRVQRLAGGNVSATAAPLTIALACSAPDVCSVPETIVLPAGNYQVTVHLTGTGLGETTLLASAAGHLPATPIPIATHLPRVGFSSLSTGMTLGSQQTYRLSLRVNESGWPTSFSVVEPFDFDLSSNFPSVLSLQHDSASVTSGNTSDWVGVEAVGVGQAQITASGAGLEPRTSPHVEVSP